MFFFFLAKALMFKASSTIVILIRKKIELAIKTISICL